MAELSIKFSTIFISSFLTVKRSIMQMLSDLNPRMKLAGIITISFILFFVLLGILSRVTIDGIVTRTYNPLLRADTFRNKVIYNDSNFSFISKEKLSFIQAQNKIIFQRKKYYLNAGILYFENYYAFSVVMVVAYIILAGLIFQIANKGWSNEQMNIVVKFSFFVVFAVSTFVSVMSISFNQKENYENNFKRYIEYDGVQEDIFSFLTSSRKKDSLEEKGKVDSFIINTSAKCRAYDEFFIKMDAANISLDEIVNRISNAKQQSDLKTIKK